MASVYLDAKAEVIQRGYASEIDWQYDTRLRKVDEPLFLRESAWVILSAGLSETAVRSRFDLVCEAFAGLQNAQEIWLRRRVRRAEALAAFRFAPKIDAILVIIGYLARVGFDHVRNRLEDGAVDFLLQFPYLGPATARHLAKNLGLPMAKPDRHLVRFASRLGFTDVSELCGAVSSIVGDPVSVVDVVFWRYATFGPQYADDLCRVAGGATRKALLNAAKSHNPRERVQLPMPIDNGTPPSRENGASGGGGPQPIAVITRGRERIS